MLISDKNITNISTKTIYSFGSPCNGQYGHIVLLPNGDVVGYYNQNERKWSIRNNKLSLYSSIGIKTSEFDYIKSENIWIGRGVERKWPYYLIPTFNFNGLNKKKDSNDFSVLVNTIPKSGTYFLTSAFANIGWKNSNFHLLGKNLIVDYRNSKNIGILDASIKNMYEFPIELLAHITNGIVIPCHTEYFEIVDYFKKNKHLVVSVVRDLRNVLVSLYKFKDIMINQDIYDDIWLSKTGNDRYKHFINHYRDKDLSHILLIADMIIKEQNSIVLKYEEMSRGEITKENKYKIDIYCDSLADRLSKELTLLYNKKTMTLISNKRSNWKDEWNDHFDNFYHSSGMAEKNIRLGYN